MPPPPIFEVRLAEARALSPQVRSLVFARTDDAPLAFEAGQWVTLLMKSAEGTDLRRSYSIASMPGAPGTADAARFEVAVTHVQGGPGSTLLHELPLGATLQVQGPQGFFTRGKGAGQPALFVGTGTGVTPLRSMIHAALRASEPTPMCLLFGVRTEVDLLYKSEFEELSRVHPNLRLEMTLSRPEESWKGRRGYVQHHLEELWRELTKSSEGAPRSAPHAYICGLNRMVGSVRELLRKDLGAEREQVHSERYD